MQVLNNLNSGIDTYFDFPITNFLNKFTSNNVLAGLCYLFTLLYISQLSPALPKVFMNMFANKYFKLLMFALVLWTAKVDPSLAILLALAFMMSVNLANEQPLWEFLENTSEMTEMSPSLETTPSVQLANDVSSDALAQSINEPTEVDSLLQETTTTIIQPKLLQTEQGMVVSNPGIVIAPLVVEKDGEKILINPEVTYVEQTPTPSKYKNDYPGCGEFRSSYEISKVKPTPKFESYAKFKIEV